MAQVFWGHAPCYTECYIAEWLRGNHFKFPGTFQQAVVIIIVSLA